MKKPSDKELWEEGCLTRRQLETWTDSDLKSHTPGVRKTLDFLFRLIDSQAPAP